MQSPYLQHYSSYKIKYFDPMKTIRQFILECDLFAHGSLQRYKQQQAYRTFAGGIISLIIITLFIIMFSKLILQTFQKNIIVAQTSLSYDDDPTLSQIITSPAHNFMFAISITNMDLTTSQRYFDITMFKKIYTKNGSKTIKTNEVIVMQPCTLQHWSGMGDSIESNFDKLNFKTWLCPPIGTIIPLEGKFTSNQFKFAQITVAACNSSNALFPNTSCHSSSDIQAFLTNNTQFTFNYYFVNTVINPNDKKFISYYLEDSNYFAFDNTLGVNANLFYTDYKIQTDTTFLPWQEYQETDGALASETAAGQNFQTSNTKTQYFKFNLRKAADNINISRSFQKVDQTFSYIGGLFGTITLLLCFMRLYSKYTYELDLGDKIFKKNNGGSFGTQNFNFILFIGYLVFNIFTKFSVILNWKTMKKFHQCRMECQKQLNIDLLFKKLIHFQEITRILLQDYQLKMLLMAPKPTIHQAKLNRKRYLIKNIVYHHLQQKAGDIHVEKSELKQQFKHFLGEQTNHNMRQIIDEVRQEHSMKVIHQDIIRSYKKLKSDTGSEVHSNKKIMQRINVHDMAQAIFSFITANMQPKIQNTNNNINQHTQGCLQTTLQPIVVDILPITGPIQISQFEQVNEEQSKRYNSIHNMKNTNNPIDL